MSAHAHGRNEGGHEEGLIHGDGPHGTLKDYLTGFILSVILTAVPFWLVMGDVSWSKQTIAFVIVAFASLTVETRTPEAYRPYSTTPTLSGEADHASITEVSVAATCRTPVGEVGAEVSGQAEVETVVDVIGE